MVSVEGVAMWKGLFGILCVCIGVAAGCGSQHRRQKAPSFYITPQTLPKGMVNAPYSVDIKVVGGTAPYTWTVTGSLPSGLSYSTQGTNREILRIEGTPRVQGVGNITVTVEDSSSPVKQAHCDYTIVIEPGVLTIKTTSLPDGMEGVSYNAQLVAVNGVTPYTWLVVSGSLSAVGLSLDASTGQIAGTLATGSAGTHQFRFCVTNANGKSAEKELSITVVPALKIATASLPDGKEGASYAAQLQADGGFPPYTWSVTSGDLSAIGLSLDQGTGDISGTPPAGSAGSHSFTFCVTDSRGNTATASMDIKVVGPLKITTTSLPNGMLTRPYGARLEATGGTAPYTWSCASGDLSALGLTLDASTGDLTATSLTGSAGTHSFTFKVTDANNDSETVTLDLEVAENLEITTVSLPNGQEGQTYNEQLQSSGGFSPLTWSCVSGDLSTVGLSLNPSTGKLSGIAPAYCSGTYNFRFRLTDAAGFAAEKDLSVTIAPAPLIVTTSSLNDAVKTKPYSQTLQASGGVLPYQWSCTNGDLSAIGLSLDSSSGEISGIPSGAAGAYDFTFKVEDANRNSFSKTLQIRVVEPLEIATTVLPDSVEGRSYNAQLQKSGGVDPVTWSCAVGNLGAVGLSLDPSTGQITGTLTAGTANNAYTFTFEVTDTTNPSQTASATLTIQVYAPLQITTTTLPNAAKGSPYNASLSATGGKLNYTWSEVTGDPDGDGYDLAHFNLTLNSNGTIIGTPNQTGQVTFRAKVVDSANPSQEAIKDLTIKVRGWKITVIDSNGNVGRYCSIAIDSQNHLHIAYQDVGNLDLKYAYYDGSAWHTETVYPPGDTGYYPRIAVDSNNTPHIIWYDKSNGNVRYAFWDSGAGVWNDKGFVPRPCRDDGNIGILIDSNDRPHLFYATGNKVRHVWHDGTSWQEEDVASAGDGTKSWTMETATKNDVMWITINLWNNDSWIPSRFTRLYICYSTVGSGTWDRETVVGKGSTYGPVVGKFASLAFSSTGTTPHVLAWNSDSDTIFLYGKVSGSWTSLYSVALNVGDSTFNRLVLDSQDKFHVVYYDKNTQRLIYTRKQGLGWPSEEILGSIDLNGLDMVIDGNDNLYVVFYDATNQCLKLATR